MREEGLRRRRKFDPTIGDRSEAWEVLVVIEKCLSVLAGGAVTDFSLVEDFRGESWTEIEEIHRRDSPDNLEGPLLKELLIQELYILDVRLGELTERAERPRSRPTARTAEPGASLPTAG